MKCHLIHRLLPCICAALLAACGGGSSAPAITTTQLSVTPAITSTWAGGPAIALTAVANGNSPITWSLSGSGGLSGSASATVFSPDPHFNTPNSVTTISASSGTASASSVVYINFESTSRFSFAATGGIVEDPAGNIYVSDAGNNVIRKITRAGAVTTFAGNGTAALVDGSATSASFNQPAGLAVLPNGNIVVADRKNNAIREIDANGNVTTIAGSSLAGYADGAGGAARFGEPDAVATDQTGIIYVADTDNHVVRRIDPGANVTTLAGTGKPGYSDGAISGSQFYSPHGLVTDTSGNIYVADSGNNAIRKISTNGLVSTVAGGTLSAASASFDFPTGVALAPAGLVVADSGNAAIRLMNPDNTVTTISGQLKTTGSQDGVQSTSSLSFPFAVATSSLGYILVVDAMNNEIRSVENGTWITRTIAGSSVGSGLVNGTALPR